MAQVRGSQSSDSPGAPRLVAEARIGNRQGDPWTMPASVPTSTACSTLSRVGPRHRQAVPSSTEVATGVGPDTSSW